MSGTGRDWYSGCVEGIVWWECRGRGMEGAQRAWYSGHTSCLAPLLWCIKIFLSLEGGGVTSLLDTYLTASSPPPPTWHTYSHLFPYCDHLSCLSLSPCPTSYHDCLGASTIISLNPLLSLVVCLTTSLHVFYFPATLTGRFCLNISPNTFMFSPLH